MKIKVPAEEEYKQLRKRKRRHFITGLVAGLILFGLNLTRVLYYGIETVEWYSWVAVGFGVIAFGVLARLFGGEFWRNLFGINK